MMVIVIMLGMVVVVVLVLVPDTCLFRVMPWLCLVQWWVRMARKWEWHQH